MNADEHAFKHTLTRRLAYRVAEVTTAAGGSRGLIYELIARNELRSLILSDRRAIPTPELHGLLGTGAER